MRALPAFPFKEKKQQLLLLQVTTAKKSVVHQGISLTAACRPNLAFRVKTCCHLCARRRARAGGVPLLAAAHGLVQGLQQHSQLSKPKKWDLYAHLTQQLTCRVVV